jgi:signal transduction histidine kinase
LSKDHLGLFDTPPGQQEVRLSLILVALLLALGAILFALPVMQLARIDAFIPIADTIMFIGDLVTAMLLYVQATVFRSRALTVLASGYVFTALMLVAHVLTFPGAFAPDGLLGAGINTTAWIAVAWRTGIPVAIIAYVFLRHRDLAVHAVTVQPDAGVAIGAFSALMLAGAIVLLTTLGHDLLPNVFLNRSDMNFPVFYGINFVIIGLFIVALAALFPNRRSVLDLWLLVTLAAWLAHAFLNLRSSGRFSLSFYSQFTLLMFSHLVLMLALLTEANRLFVRLALSTAARNRERDNRLMSMDGVAAAISHEVGQPLTAVMLNARGGLAGLTASPPDVGMAANALRAILDAGQNTFDIIKSIRATFGVRSMQTTEFDINDLVRSSLKSLDAELTRKSVSLRLMLDEAPPPIRASRVQIQRVLVNLITNAMESMGDKPDRPMHIAIRTVSLDGGGVLLEVTDNGSGIKKENVERIFEAFFTTKPAGTGLGLSLCRTIIEEHGGHLWVTPGANRGATFHIQLPSRVALSTVAIGEPERSRATS